MYESILIGIPIVLGMIQYIRILRKQVAGLEHENQALEKSLEITAEMEAAKVTAEIKEKQELEKVEADDWRNKI